MIAIFDEDGTIFPFQNITCIHTLMNAMDNNLCSVVVHTTGHAESPAERSHIATNLTKGKAEWLMKNLRAAIAEDELFFDFVVWVRQTYPFEEAMEEEE